MNSLTNHIPSVTLPDLAAAEAPQASSWNTISAVAGVVLKELYRRKDFYVLFVLTAVITLLMGSVSLFSQDAAVRPTKEVCLALIWISSLVITVTTTARQIPMERENRTIFPLLAKPVSRAQLILGKFAGCWAASGLSLVLFYLFFAVVTGAREHALPLAHYFQLLTFHWFMLGIVCALALLGSLVFAAPSSNNTITLIVTFAMLLVGRHLNKVALKLTEPAQSLVYGLYFLLPHLEFFDVRDLVIHNLGVVPWEFWGLALGYAGIWMALLLAGACWLFRRRAIH